MKTKNEAIAVFNFGIEVNKIHTRPSKTDFEETKIKINCSDQSIKDQSPNFRGLRGKIFLNADFSSDASERCCEETVRTISGRRCQKWNSKSPHEPNKNMVDYLQRHDFI